MKEIRTQIVFIICFLAAWQIVYQMQAFPELLFPSLKEIGSSFVTGFKDNSLLEYTLYSMSLSEQGVPFYLQFNSVDLRPAARCGAAAAGYPVVRDRRGHDNFYSSSFHTVAYVA